MLAEHLQTLELESEPFTDGPAGPAFFATPALTQRLDLLQHLIQYSDLLLVLTGPPGSGKTTVLAQVIETVGQQWSVCPITPTGKLGVRALLDKMLTGLDVPARGVVDDPPERRLGRLAAHLESLSAHGELAAIVIDDADRLEDDALELVTQLAKRSQHLKARILLAGPAPLAERLRSLAADAGANGTVHPVDLPALTEDQTGDYLHTRLRAAGMRGDSPFAPETIAHIRRESKGRPAQINALAQDALVEVSLARAQTVRRSRLTGVLMQWWKGLAVVAVALLIVALAIVLLSATPPPKGQVSGPATIIDIPDRPQREAPPSVMPNTDPPRGDPSLLIRGDASPLDVGGAPRSIPAPVPSEDTPLSAGAGAAPNPGSSVQRDAASVDTNGRPAVSERPLAPSSMAAGTAQLPARLPVLKPVPVPIPAPPKAPIDRAPPATASGGAPRDLAWLRTQPPSNYTLQLMGTHDLAAMRRYLSSSGIGANGAWFTTEHQGRPWYVVVYGMYASRADALASLATLPPDLRRQNPWLRTVGSIVSTAR